MNADVIKNRSEIAFFYDVTEGNPNGDPDENKPRIDEETDQCLVTDVRLKRTVRDFLRDHRGKTIYVTRVDDEAVTAKQRMEQVFETAAEKLKDAYKKVSEGKANSEETQEVKKYVCEQLIDIRLFGSTAALAKGEEARGGSIILTGPVQFRMLGKSLHSVDPREVKGTGGFKSREGVTQTTFREDNLLPYALIAFYGTVNENVAKKTLLSENDLILLQDGLWNGTINLNTRSKGEHRPRLLLRVEWRDGNYHMGGLDRMVVLEPFGGKDGRSIRSLKDYALDAAELVEKIRVQKDRIQRIIISEDTDIKWKAGRALRAQLEEVLDKEKEKIQKFDPNDEKLKPKKD